MKEKVYMVCDYADTKAKTMGALEIGVEFMGNCGGRILKGDGSLIGSHHSSSFGWLREDLKYKLKDLGGESAFEIIDLIGQEIPDRFKRS